MSDKQSSNVAQLPDGWKMYDKYQIRHTDGTPLKGKKYFVLRLDSDNPAEAARVAAAMRAYKGELSDGNGAKTREALKFLIKHKEWLRGHNLTMTLEDLETIDRILGKADAALATPPRNCDVGTAEEQEKRFDDFVQDRRGDLDCTGKCPAHNGVDFGVVACVLQWAQMPYEEGGAK